MADDQQPDIDTEAVIAAEPAPDGPKARDLFRRGAVYGLAGVLRAGDVAAAAARGAMRGAREASGEREQDPASRGE